MKANTASVAVSNAVIQNHLNDALPRPLMAQVTLPHPSATSSSRSFDVLVNAPPGTQGGADSPFYAGTIGFFGNMTGMKMSHDATFIVPLAQEPAGVRQQRPRRALRKTPSWPRPTPPR